jgi:hypothetical protein
LNKKRYKETNSCAWHLLSFIKKTSFARKRGNSSCVCSFPPFFMLFLLKLLSQSQFRSIQRRTSVCHTINGQQLHHIRTALLIERPSNTIEAIHRFKVPNDAIDSCARPRNPVFIVRIALLSPLWPQLIWFAALDGRRNKAPKREFTSCAKAKKHGASRAATAEYFNPSRSTFRHFSRVTYAHYDFWKHWNSLNVDLTVVAEY